MGIIQSFSESEDTYTTTLATAAIMTTVVPAHLLGIERDNGNIVRDDIDILFFVGTDCPNDSVIFDLYFPKDNKQVTSNLSREAALDLVKSLSTTFSFTTDELT